MNNPKLYDVSFVVTVYNKRDYLPLVCASLRQQKNMSDRTEYIFVDDGSTDGSYELLQELTGGWPNVKLVTRKNGGQTAAMNAGIRLVSNPYVKMWDADDYAHPDLTWRLAEATEKHGTGIAYCKTVFSPFERPEQVEAILDDLKNVSITDSSALLKNSTYTIIKTPVMNPTGCLVTKDLLDKIGPLDERLVVADVYMTYAATLFTEFARLDGGYAYAFKEVASRLTNNEAQIMHDINGALYCFFDHFHDVIPTRMKRYVAQRATGRAWKWASRLNRRSCFSGDFMRFIKARLGLSFSRMELYKTLLPFREGQTIRTAIGAPAAD